MFILLAFVFSLSLSAQQAKKDTTRSIDPAGDLYKAALKKIDSAQYKEAIKLLNQSIKKNPELTTAYNKLALCKMQTNDFKGAQKDLQKSLKLAPDNQECLKYLGRAFFKEGKYFDSARVYYDSSLKLVPEDCELLVYIAELKVLGKNKKGAITSLDEALFHKPNYAPALFMRGILKYEMGEYNYAIKDLNDGFKESKDTNYNSEIYQTRAKAYFEVGNYKASLKDYDKVLEREPKNEDALVNRAAAKININDNSGAIVDLDKALLLNKKSYVAYNFRGTAKTGLKQYEEAIKDFDTSIKLKFDYSSAYVNRAAAKMSKKDKKGACVDLEKADQLGSPVAYKLIQQYCTGTGIK